MEGRVVCAEHGGGRGGGDGHGEDEADGADEHPDDLDRDYLARTQAADRLGTLREEEEQGREAPAWARIRVLTAEAKWSRPTREASR